MLALYLFYSIAVRSLPLGKHEDLGVVRDRRVLNDLLELDHSGIDRFSCAKRIGHALSP